MKADQLATLTSLLSPYVELGNHRLQTLCLLISSLVSARTVNLSHLAAERAGEVLVASTYRRLQRFFQYVRPPEDWAAQLIVALSGAQPPWLLCLDRTNWKIGKKEANILVPAIVTRRFRVPLMSRSAGAKRRRSGVTSPTFAAMRLQAGMWTILDRAGTSNTEERIALLSRYLARFEAASIRLLLADREFIGLKWLAFLDRSKVPFAIRMKENLIVSTNDGRTLSLASLLRRCRGRKTVEAAFEAAGDGERLDLHFAARRLDGGELLIVASNALAANPLNAYRKRWAIECWFGDAKTRGFNLEDTRLTSADKLGLLLAVVALAVAWVCRTATDLMGKSAPKRKKHGHYAKSWFRIGFDELRRRLRTKPDLAIACWAKIPKSCAVA
ncbi:MAG: transposase [Rhizobiales bacterium]|nr:transposase [Hyphomicrobiales bacterium]